MTDGQRRNLELVSFLPAGALAGVLTGLVAPLGAFSRAELLLFCVASALFGTMAWISRSRCGLFPGLLLVIVLPVASELLNTPALFAGATAAGLVLREPFRLKWQPALAGLVLGALSALLFGAVDFLVSRPASR